MNIANVVIEEPRDVLSAILRRAAPSIIVRIAEEAARSTHAGAEDVAAYIAWMNAAAAIVLDAIAADEPQRAQALARFGAVEVDTLRPVPPVARVGLLEIGIRLAHDVVMRETASRPDGIEVELEFRRFAQEMRAALRAAGAVNGQR